MKYKSCHLLEKGIIFTWKDILNCCMYNADDNANVLSNKPFDEESFSLEKILDKKEQLRNEFKQGKISKGCLNCHNLEEMDWDDKREIKYIYVSHWTKCNCYCFYCYYRPEKEFFQKFKNKKLLPLLKQMKKDNILNPDGYVIITGGEPSELDELPEIIDFCLKSHIKEIYLNTSGIKYEKSIEEALKKDNIAITISLDSSNRALYKKIKQTDSFEKVINNIKKYVSAQGEIKTNVRLKYIIIPTINDKKEEIENWLTLCKTLEVKKVILDIETHWYERNKNNIPVHIKELINYFKKRTDELNMEKDFYSHLSQINYEEESNGGT